MPALKIDPARFEVVKNALTCAAEEMKIVLAKTAYSPLLKVAGDYSCGIFDITGNMVAQGPDLPIHLGSMPDAVRAIVRAFPDVAPGDVFIHNDPYQGGSHLPDVNVVAPAFLGDTLLGLRLRARALAGHRLRHARQLRRRDRNITARACACRRCGCIAAASPTPASRRSSSPTSARPRNGWAICAPRWRRTGAPARRLAALAEKYGAAELLEIMQEVQDYSETMMRAALARAARRRGVEFTDVFDGDGVIAPGETEDATFTVRLRIGKRGDTITR